MAGSKTAYLSQKLLDHALGGTTFTRPTTVYIALSTAPFTAAATGAAMNEVAGGAYARVAVTNNSTNWSAATAASPSEKHNNLALVFPAASASWGTPQSAYVCDASTAGNALYGADITNPQLISIGDTAQIAASTFVFNEV